MKEYEVKVGDEVKDTMKSCLRFNQKERMTIPQLLSAPFLRGEGKSPGSDGAGDGPSSTKDAAGLPTIDDNTMNALIQRVTKMVTGKQLEATEGRKLAGVSCGTG